MKEVIEEILIAEKQARKVVAESREKAKSIRLEAEKKAQELLDHAKGDAQKRSADIGRQAEIDAEAEKKNMLKNTEIRHMVISQDEKKRIETMDALFNMIIGASDQR